MASGVAALAFYLLAIGLVLLGLTGYWERLPLDRRDGQAFMGVGILGFVFLVLGTAFGALSLATRPRGGRWLLGALAFGLALMALAFYLLPLPWGILFLPTAVFAALGIRLGARELAGSLAVAASGALIVGTYAALGGPRIWLGRAFDEVMIIGSLAIAVLVFLLANRFSGTRVSSTLPQ